MKRTAERRVIDISILVLILFGTVGLYSESKFLNTLQTMSTYGEQRAKLISLLKSETRNDERSRRIVGELQAATEDLADLKDLAGTYARLALSQSVALLAIAGALLVMRGRYHHAPLGSTRSGVE